MSSLADKQRKRPSRGNRRVQLPAGTDPTSANAQPLDAPPLPRPEVVGKLSPPSPHPYTSISLSPSKRHAVTATNDTLQLVHITPAGLTILQSVPCAPLFLAPSNSMTTGGGRATTTSSTFFKGPSYGMTHATTARGPALTNVVINHVAWSGRTTHNNGNGSASRPTDDDDFGDAWIAAGGSNGCILLWRASRLVADTKATGGTVPPDAVLRQHARAVNRIAWHPTDTSVFLSASQDGTVRMWEHKRQKSRGSQDRGNGDHTDTASGGPPRLFHQLWGAGGSAGAADARSLTWQPSTVFEPKSEAVRDVAWNPLEPDIFALVTAGGTLVAYHRRVKVRSLVKLTAHGREASCLDWHPRLPHIVATGGANDGSVKVWDLSRQLDPEHWNIKTPISATLGTSTHHSANFSSVNSKTDFSVVTESSDNTDRSSPSLLYNRTAGSGGAGHASLSTRAVHVLSVAAAVTRVKWRPSAGESFVPAQLPRPNFDDDNLSEEDPTEHPLQSDRHDALLAISTAPVGWLSTGGAGVVGLWSCHRPFMALSVVEGHREGAVVDFCWLETPVAATQRVRPLSTRLVTNTPPTANVLAPSISGGDSGRRSRPKNEDSSSLRSTASHRNEYDIDSSEHLGTPLDAPQSIVGIWQHVLSVGKDGHCLVQSLMAGDRPLKRVPPSCFAMANLSPFQRGCGSLQLFTVCQPVPSGPRNDFLLTGLRKDSVTAEAPGMFREIPTEEDLAAKEISLTTSSQQWSAARRLPPRDPVMVFNVLDQGDLTEGNLPVSDEPEAITVASEMVHLSRFAGSYKLRPTEQFPTRASLCQHNSQVANQLHCYEVTHLWTTLASLLEGAGTDGLLDNNGHATNVMQFLILPTVKSMLEELATDGDVQTCVAICEVLEVLNGDGTTKIPDLDIHQVREVRTQSKAKPRLSYPQSLTIVLSKPASEKVVLVIP
jgi:WD40 repeat protein